MKDPVIDCFGHTYERRGIEKALLHKPGYSPMTNEKYPGGDAKLQTNFALRQAIEEMVPETQQPAGGSARSSAAGESTTHPAERVRPCVLHSQDRSWSLRCYPRPSVTRWRCFVSERWARADRRYRVWW